MKDKHIIVLMGGPSAEAEVSRRTGAAIAEALISKGYHVSTLELIHVLYYKTLKTLRAILYLMRFTDVMVKMALCKAH